MSSVSLDVSGAKQRLEVGSNFVLIEGTDSAEVWVGDEPWDINGQAAAQLWVGAQEPSQEAPSARLGGLWPSNERHHGPG